LRMPHSPQILADASVVPASAGRDFVSGQVFGQFNVDIKWQLDECLPDS